MASGVKEQDMVAQFENLLEKLLAAHIIDSSYKESFQDIISKNQDWLDKNYYDIQVYFGLQEPTSKFHFPEQHCLPYCPYYLYDCYVSTIAVKVPLRQYQLKSSHAGE